MPRLSSSCSIATNCDLDHWIMQKYLWTMCSVHAASWTTQHPTVHGVPCRCWAWTPARIGSARVGPACMLGRMRLRAGLYVLVSIRPGQPVTGLCRPIVACTTSRIMPPTPSFFRAYLHYSDSVIHPGLHFEFIMDRISRYFFQNIHI